MKHDEAHDILRPTYLANKRAEKGGSRTFSHMGVKNQLAHTHESTHTEQIETQRHARAHEQTSVGQNESRRISDPVRQTQ